MPNVKINAMVAEFKNVRVNKYNNVKFNNGKFPKFGNFVEFRISTVLKNGFYFNSFSLDFQLMKVTE